MAMTKGPGVRKRTVRPQSKKAKTQKGWKSRSRSGLRILQADALAKLPWLVHGFSTRGGGVSKQEGRQVLNLGFTEWDSRENVKENRKKLQAVVGAGRMKLTPVLQFHSDSIVLFEKAPSEPARGDASITRSSGLLLAIQTADCVPILLVDAEHRAIAAVHAGWRGTLARIVEKAIGRMQMEFNTRPGELLAAVGPSIGGCCYEVGTEVATAFNGQFANAAEFFDELRTGDEPNPLQWLNMMPPGHQPPPKKVLLDLRKANRAQLMNAGVAEKNIFVSDLCTACRRDLLFSYRKEGLQSGRMMAVVGIKGSKN
jgi:polyphenol oxidase